MSWHYPDAKVEANAFPSPLRLTRWIAVAKIWIDALSQTGGVRPLSFLPDVVRPGAKVIKHFSSLIDDCL
jgi:hypothetical protein